MTSIARKLYKFVNEETNYIINVSENNKEFLQSSTYDSESNITLDEIKDLIKTLFDFIVEVTKTENSIGIGNIRTILMNKYGIYDNDIEEIRSW